MDPTQILHQLANDNDDRLAGKSIAREKMLVAAQALVASLQIPSELIASMGWKEPAKFACIRIAIDLKIFETLSQYGQNGASAAELAQTTSADVALVSRIMRHLVATCFIDQVSEDLYCHSAMSAQFVESRYRDGVIMLHDSVGPSFQKLSQYLATSEYRNPSETCDGPFQFAHNTSNEYFGWLEEKRLVERFGNYMMGYRQGKMPWYAPGFFPVQSGLIDGYIDGTFMVDVGGGKGHDLLGFASNFPSIKGGLILQEKPEVIELLDQPLSPLIKTMVHNFFTPQPVKNARVYFMHSILHGWNDEDCIRILLAIKSAMAPGYSKVLVHDNVLADEHPAWGMTSMDMVMMVTRASCERTESDFRRLFGIAGLQIDHIWVYEPNTEAIIEASLPL